MPPSCAIGARDALLWQLMEMCGRDSGNPPGPAHAARTTHARKHAPAIKSMRLLLCDVICNEAVPFRVATRTRNVSEYMLVLALCLVHLVAMDLRRNNVGLFTVHFRLIRRNDMAVMVYFST